MTATHAKVSFTNRFCFAKEIARGRSMDSVMQHPPLDRRRTRLNLLGGEIQCPMKPIMNGDDEAKAVCPSRIFFFSYDRRSLFPLQKRKVVTRNLLLDPWPFFPSTCWAASSISPNKAMISMSLSTNFSNL